MLLCIDLQPVFLDAIPDGRRALGRCHFAVKAATGLGLPVAFTEQVPERLGPTDPALRAAAPGAPAWGKHAFSALGDEHIRAILLQTNRVPHLLLCGIETPVCVYQTAIAALREDVAVTILSDAVAARRPDDAEVCLAALARLGAHILPSETVFYALLQDARHPFFRDYTRLVKTHHTAAP